MDFDVEATFGDDYLYFYAESTDAGHSDDDAAEILGRLQLPPGSRVLDVPCGGGRISRSSPWPDPNPWPRVGA
jgi:hypothetical protein